MRLRCPGNPEHDRFDVASEEVLVIDRVGDPTGKSYAGDWDIDKAVCTDCDVLAIDDESFEVQSLKTGDKCPCCGMACSIIVGPTYIRHDDCGFAALKSEAVRERHRNVRLDQIEKLCREMQLVGGAFEDLAMHLVRNGVFPASSVAIRSAVEPSDSIEVADLDKGS